MTISTVVTAMQVINEAITGVNSAPDKYPGSIETADMPITLIWPGPAESKQEALSFNYSRRVYRVICYIMPIQQGLGIDEGLNEAEVLMQRHIDAWLDSDNARLLSFATGSYEADVQQGRSFPITDTGLEAMAYPPQATGLEGYPHYFAFELQVTVNEKWNQT